MNKNNLPIGVFDSGVGGLTVLQQLKKTLPNENFIYFGDTAHVPYGNKSQETIERYCLDIVSFLNNKNVKIIIIACNTASSIALNKIKRHIKTPILNVIDPCIEKAVNITQNQAIGILGTKTTIDSKAYEQKIKSINNNITIYNQECSLFVPIIEESLIHHPIAMEAVKLYLGLLPDTIDTLILGCTHYPLIKNLIKNYISSNIKILDSSIIMSKHVKKFLTLNKLLNSCSDNPKIKFYVSDDSVKFNKFMCRFTDDLKGIIKEVNL